MSDIYEIKPTWQSRFTKEETIKFCEHYDKPNTEWKEQDDGTFSPENSYWLHVNDNPVNFKQMFPNTLVEVGDAVATTQGLEIVNSLRSIEDKLTSTMLNLRSAGVPNKPAYESDGKTRVAMPEWFMAHIRKVEVRNDCCTDALQSDLDDGWHILAICPQPGQRRPDYILGRL